MVILLPSDPLQKKICKVIQITDMRKQNQVLTNSINNFILMLAHLNLHTNELKLQHWTECQEISTLQQRCRSSLSAFV